VCVQHIALSHRAVDQQRGTHILVSEDFLQNFGIGAVLQRVTDKPVPEAMRIEPMHIGLLCQSLQQQINAAAG